MKTLLSIVHASGGTATLLGKDIQDPAARKSVGYLPDKLVVMDEEQHPISRAAAGFILEMFWPDWRKHVAPSIVGMVVERSDGEVHRWRWAVLERDGRRCTNCGATRALHAHHIVRWSDAPALRLVIESGRTLCKTCHYAEHHQVAA